MRSGRVIDVKKTNRQIEDKQTDKIMAEKEEATVEKEEKPRKKVTLSKKSQIEDLKAALAKEKDDYVRLMAEFENYRRRSAQERLDLITTASEKIILDILPVLDDCERALKALEDSSDAQAAKEGTQMIYNKLTGILKSKGLKEIEAMGEPFDTETMEAVAQFPVQEEDKKGKVFDVVQKGYTLGTKVIRFAKVVVGQ